VIDEEAFAFWFSDLFAAAPAVPVAGRDHPKPVIPDLKTRNGLRGRGFTHERTCAL